MRFEITCEDKQEVVRKTLALIFEHQIDLHAVDTAYDDKVYLSVKDIEFALFQDLMRTIRFFSGVTDIKTVLLTPSETQHFQLNSLIDLDKSPLIIVDKSGTIIRKNESARYVVRTIGSKLPVHAWLEQIKAGETISTSKIGNQSYCVDVAPYYISEDDKTIFAGAIIKFKDSSAAASALDSVDNGSYLNELFSKFTAESLPMTKLIRGLKSVCGLASPIVLIGEMGTGKSALAHAVHRASQRDNKCFEELDLLAIPQSRMQQVLFGKTEGLIAKAHGGTLVIDNINAADFEVQRKLKYFLETGSFLTDCGQYEIQADTRIIFLSRLSLESDLANNLIDESLYYQISRYTLLVPSLVDRKQDLAGLCSSIIADHCAKLNKANLKISQNCMDVISHYRWDGNVKQLQNALCRAVSLSDTNTIESIDIQLPNILVTEPLDVQRMAGTLDQEVKNFERNLLAKLYPDYPSTRLLGKKLGLSHTAVANKLREYGINKQNLQF